MSRAQLDGSGTQVSGRCLPAAARYLWPRDERGEDSPSSLGAQQGRQPCRGKAANPSHKNPRGWITPPVRAWRVLGLDAVVVALQTRRPPAAPQALPNRPGTAMAECEHGGNLRRRSFPAVPLVEVCGLSVGKGHLLSQAALLLSQSGPASGAILRDREVNHGNKSWRLLRYKMIMTSFFWCKKKS